MDMLEFLRTLVPDDGFRFITEWIPKENHPRGGVMPHYPFVDFTDMVDKANELDAKGKNVYFAMASFKEVQHKKTDNGFEYVTGRLKNNALNVKCLWQDFDVGKGDKEKSYETRKDALESLKLYVREVGLPEPMLVNSGYGLHAYWPFEEAIPANEWERIASMQRVIFNFLNVKFDPARDKDCASVLRPIGTHNYKDGKPAREVTLITAGSGATPHQKLDSLLYSYIEANELALPKPSANPWAALGLFATNDMASVEYPESSMVNVAQHCAQVKHFADTGGESEPEWYVNLGLAKHCVDGEKLAHEWGAKYQGYDAEHTSSKMEQWGYGPPTCAKFADVSSERCADCPNAGKVTSPIQLGHILEHEAPAIEVKNEETGEVESQRPPHWPRAASVVNGIMNYTVLNEEGVPTGVAFASPMFWPEERIRLEDGTYGFRMAMVVKKGEPLRHFDIPLKSVVDGKSLRLALGAYECIVYNDKLAVRFMSDYSTLMRQHTDETHTYNRFGWRNSKHDAFLIGDTLISKSGVTKVRLGERVLRSEELSHTYEVKGTREQWIAGVEELYNIEHGEPYQYAICTAFGSVLVPLMHYDDWNGIPLAITTGDTALGKTTVAKIGINAISSARRTTVAQATYLAVSGRASTMGNLVVLFDEMSDKSAIELRNILYSLSNGLPKIGMQSDGTERKAGARWKLNSIITGNRNFFFKLTESQDNPEAPQMRVFEIDLTQYPLIESFRPDGDQDLRVRHYNIASDIINNTSCVFSEEYIQFVIANHDLIRERLQTTVSALSRSLGAGGNKERFYVYHAACTLIGGWIAKKLGYINFDINALKRWAFNHILRLRDLADSSHNTPRDKFSDLLSDLHGRLIVTKRFESLNARINQTELPMYPVRAPVAGRIVLGDGGKDKPTVFITTKALDEWCKDHGYSSIQLRREFEESGLLRNTTRVEGGKRRRDRSVSLGRGIPGISLGEPRCLEFSFNAAQGFLDDLPGGNPNVIEFPTQGHPESSEESSAG